MKRDIINNPSFPSKSARSVRDSKLIKQKKKKKLTEIYFGKFRARARVLFSAAKMRWRNWKIEAASKLATVNTLSTAAATYYRDVSRLRKDNTPRAIHRRFRRES